MIFDRVLSYEESSEVLAQLREFLKAEKFHARGIVQSHDSIEQWHIEVDLVAEQWFAIDEQGHTHEFCNGVTIHRGETAERPTRAWEELVGPLIAAFPERLRWWGERSHDFRPVLAERVGKQSVLLTFEHGSDPSMRSTLVADTTLGLATRVMDFDSPYILLLDVELDRGIERIVPDEFPALEIVYPKFWLLIEGSWHPKHQDPPVSRS